MRFELCPDQSVIVRDALTDTLCDRLIALFEADPSQHPGETTQGRLDIKSSTDVVPRPDGPWADAMATFDRQRDAALDFAYEHADWFFAKIHSFYDLYYSSPLVQRYQANGQDEFRWHVDAQPGDRRMLACIFYLNTVADGGETEFMHGLRVAPEKGAMLVFPPYWTHVHRGNMVTAGTKYIATCFVSGAIPEPDGNG